MKFDGGSDPAKGCFEKLENKTPNDCLTVDDTAAAETAIDTCVAALVAAIDPPPLDQSKCGAGKKKCAAKYLAALLKCRKVSQTPKKPTDPNTKGCVDKATAKYTSGADPAKGCFAKLEAKADDCQSTTDSPAVQALVEHCLSCNPVDCDDGNACTTDTCDPAIGCIHTPVDCSDGLTCTDDVCVPSGTGAFLATRLSTRPTAAQGPAAPLSYAVAARTARWCCTTSSARPTPPELPALLPDARRPGAPTRTPATPRIWSATGARAAAVIWFSRRAWRAAHSSRTVDG
jgi:hypothetical protein